MGVQTYVKIRKSKSVTIACQKRFNIFVVIIIANFLVPHIDIVNVFVMIAKRKETLKMLV